MQREKVSRSKIILYSIWVNKLYLQLQRAKFENKSITTKKRNKLMVNPKSDESFFSYMLFDGQVFRNVNGDKVAVFFLS